MPITKRPVRILSTGGTFEKTYDPILESMTFDQTSVVPEILRRIGTPDIPFSILMLIDSLEMQLSHRAKIVEAIDSYKEGGIVVVHGTSTMVETGQYLAGLGITKAIVLLGALCPVRVRSAEGAFNLGFAIAAASLLGNGVFIAMNGQILNPKHTEKDLKTGHFIEHRK